MSSFYACIIKLLKELKLRRDEIKYSSFRLLLPVQFNFNLDLYLTR